MMVLMLREWSVSLKIEVVYKAKRLVNIAVFGTKSMNLFGAVWPIDVDVIFWFLWFIFWWLVDIMSEEESKM